MAGAGAADAMGLSVAWKENGNLNDLALVSQKMKEIVNAEGWCTKAVKAAKWLNKVGQNN